MQVKLSQFEAKVYVILIATQERPSSVDITLRWHKELLLCLSPTDSSLSLAAMRWPPSFVSTSLFFDQWAVLWDREWSDRDKYL